MSHQTNKQELQPISQSSSPLTQEVIHGKMAVEIAKDLAIFPKKLESPLLEHLVTSCKQQQTKISLLFKSG